MRNIGLVLWHTFYTKVVSKTFFFTSFFMILFMSIILNIEAILDFFDDDPETSVYSVAVVDETEEVFGELEHVFDQRDETIHFEQYDSSRVSDEEVYDRYDAMLFIEGTVDHPVAHYEAPSINQSYLPRVLESEIQSIAEEKRIEQSGISEEVIENIAQPITFSLEASDDNARSEAELDQARFFVYILLFVIYFTVLFLGNMIASEVATEKSSRVMELLITSTSPAQQMFGKILGVGLVGLTQYSIIFLVALVTFGMGMDGSLPQVSGNVGQAEQDMIQEASFSIELFLLAFVYFVLGYFLYATLAAMLGSLVTRIEDVGLAVGPMNMLVILALLISMFSLGNPSATITTVTSYIPFFTPMIMFLRVGMGEASSFEMILSFVLLFISIAILMVIATRVYRGGVLLYSQGRLIEMIKRALIVTNREKDN
ncbi:ABC transporter permease [Geomicrobium sediminis]|uniref:ABC-2 type transport system permease protein n=1 Tax=Geomicrobium sediminis TaxID=1347788 RepID=A0ABS2PEV8_9BACL|nr:ABC transporter permease [Geomicrobium sediminis]MBM7633964.1 ABC-2 type transport system permease protein [Geomicrobium sediminis]